MARSRAPRIIGRIFRLLMVILILTVTYVLVWRIFFSEDYEKVKGLTPNEKLRQAYDTYGEELVLQYQVQPSITKSDKSYGYFSVVECVFIPQINQVQLVVRYNNSTLDHLKEDYALSEAPDRYKDVFDVTLSVTSDNPADAVRIFPTEEPQHETTKLYSYRRYTFDNVPLNDLTVGVFVDIYYNGDIDYEKEAYGTLLIYDRSAPWVEYNPTKKEWERID